MAFQPGHLKYKYIKYLEFSINNKKYINATEKTSLSRVLNKLKTNEGLCYFDALQHAIMQHIGELPKLIKMREQLEAWDEKSDPYKIKIPNSTTTLAELFEKEIWLALFCHEGLPSRKYKHIQQHNILKKHIKVSINKKNINNNKITVIKKIKNYENIAGHLKTNHIITILESNALKQNITLLHTPDHTTSIWHENKQYYFYDNNFPKNLSNKFTNIKNNIMRCKTAAECASKIELCLGNNLAFEFASLDTKKIKLPLDILKQQNPEKFLQGFGLHLMAKHSPDTLTKLITLTKKPGKNLIITMVDALTKQAKNKYSGFHFISTCAKPAAETLIKIAENEINSHGNAKLCFAFFERFIVDMMSPEKSYPLTKTEYSFITTNCDLFRKIFNKYKCPTSFDKTNLQTLSKTYSDAAKHHFTVTNFYKFFTNKTNNPISKICDSAITNKNHNLRFTN